MIYGASEFQIELMIGIANFESKPYAYKKKASSELISTNQWLSKELVEDYPSSNTNRLGNIVTYPGKLNY